VERIKSFFKSVRHWPVIEPLLDLFSKERVVVLALGAVGYYLVPSIPNLSPFWAQRLGDLIFVGGGILLAGLQLEVLIETRRGLPTTLEGYVQSVATEIITPAATVKTEQMPVPLSATPIRDGSVATQPG
jgi:hypothetical protein